MSILINMEMPKSCGECAIKSWDGEDDVCPFSGISALSIGRQDDCPLVPAPPHGRLIDADVVFKRLQKQAMSVWGNGNPRYQIVLEVMDAIRFAPTIIPAEEGE